MPFIRQIPKVRGFKSFRPKNETVALERLTEVFSDRAVITPKALKDKGLITSIALPVKVLGKTTLTKQLEFEGIKFSAAARAAVEQAGGKIKDV